VSGAGGRTHLAALGMHTIDDLDSGEVVDPRVEPRLIQHHNTRSTCCDKDCSVGIERYVIRIRLRSSSRGEGTVEL
jgi:hypothetical protein